jgi:drug/metabolite transporter (DMT)-like permease
MRSSGVGLSFGLISAATFGSSGSFASALIRAGWTPGAAVLVRVGLASLVLTAPAVMQLRGRWGMLRANAGPVIGFGVAAVGLAQLCYFNAVERIPVGVALLLEYSGTVLVVGWMWLRHGHRPGRTTIAGAVVALTGLVLVLDIGGVSHVDPIGALWGLGAAVGLAAYFVLSAASSHDALPPLALAWAGLVCGAITLGLLAAIGAVPVSAPAGGVTLAGHHVSWVVPAAGLVFIAAVAAYLSGIAASRLLGARMASFLGLSEVLAAVAFAWLLLGQAPTAIQFVGGALIVAGVAVLKLGEPSGEPSPAHGAPEDRPLSSVSQRRVPSD